MRKNTQVRQRTTSLEPTNEALRESERRLKKTQEIAHLGSWELDLVNNRLSWSDEVYRIFGLKPQEFKATYEAFLEAVHPDDREAVDDAYSGSLREGRDTYEIEHKVVRKSTGEIRFVHEKCEHIRDATGRIIRSIGMVHDITERKLAQEALQKTHDELELRVKERTREIYARNVLLKTLSKASSRKEYADVIVKLIKGWTSCRCVGIRLLNGKGKIPYESYTGFSQEFWEFENWLSLKEDECACTRVMRGKPEPVDSAFMTKTGSFYLNKSLKFVRSLCEENKAKFRGVCMKNGFNSVAVVPVRYKENIIGVIHLADEREDKVSLDIIEFIEGLTVLIGEGTNKFNLEDKIRKEQTTFEAFFNHAITPLVFLDRDFNFIRVNEAYAKSCQRDVSDFPGHNHFEFYPHEENERIFRQVVESKKPFRAFAKPFSYPDHPEWGVTYWDWTLIPLLNDEDEVDFLVFFLNDVTERKRAEEELLRTQKELDNAKRLSDIGTLAATVAHELRSPLGVIRTAAYNIRKKARNPSIEGNIANIEKKILESDQIINNLLSYSRIKMPTYQKVKIYDIIQECADSVSNRFGKQKVSIVKKIDTIKKNFIEADPIQINEVFNNILNNAFEALPDQNGRIEIKAVINGQNNINISFKDNGTGIEEENLKRIFEPFFTTKPKGIGLGLSICNEIINLHNSRIDIESQKNKGTTVTVTLPVQKAPSL